MAKGSFCRSLCRAHVTLIPKEENPETIQKFRPITLLNVAYKVLSKVLVNRIRPLLQNLIGPHQNSFLPGRSTIDNIILSQEALFFADDLMLFAEATAEQLKEVLKCLEDFSKVSGLTINYDKSKIYFSPNMCPQAVRNWSSLSGIPCTRNLGTYLGIPLRHGKVPRNQYHYILDRMRAKLANWKANSLNLAGRVILVKSVMSSIPVYTMQSQLLPSHICTGRASSGPERYFKKV